MHSIDVMDVPIVRNCNFPYSNTAVELIHIHNVGGRQIIGNRIGNFRKGKMVLIGPGLSHFWKFDDIPPKEKSSKYKPKITVLHFKEDFWGNDFLNLPENKAIKSVLLHSRRGIEITGTTRRKIGQSMQLINNSVGTKRIVILLEILTLISCSKEINMLSTLGVFKNFNLTDRRIQLIYSFIRENFKRKIELGEIADVANLCPNYFCRFFKSNTGITYTEMVNDIRVNHACHLLIKNQTNIQMVALESGFNNFASFFKSFKRIIGISPLKYQQLYFD
ncbi:AraC family transcriptional regulator [Lunatibacter salilacus]|uniref:AraC family transcriptional regulator n=1 Tax=Lunatibacter salilacus TaxID=2483804 RepID=UPI00131B9DAB|nr:AraC family transcriptional regulator [Lunatibacter salilacus]